MKPRDLTLLTYTIQNLLDQIEKVDSKPKLWINFEIKSSRYQRNKDKSAHATSTRLVLYVSKGTEIPILIAPWGNVSRFAPKWDI